jgi:hypothetical protein
LGMAPAPLGAFCINGRLQWARPSQRPILCVLSELFTYKQFIHMVNIKPF